MITEVCRETNRRSVVEVNKHHLRAAGLIHVWCGVVWYSRPRVACHHPPLTHTRDLLSRDDARMKAMRENCQQFHDGRAPFKCFAPGDLIAFNRVITPSPISSSQIYSLRDRTNWDSYKTYILNHTRLNRSNRFEQDSHPSDIQ